MKDLNDAHQEDPERAKGPVISAEGAEVILIPTLEAEAGAAAIERAAETRRAALEKEAPHVGSFFRESVKVLKARATGLVKPVALPWAGVAERLGGGLWPGLHVLTGATGTGKTQFALQAAWKASGSGPVLYIGLELGRLDVVARLLALAEGDATGRTPKWSDLFLGHGDASGARLERLAETHAAELEAREFRAEFGPPHGWSYEELVPRVQAMREAHPETHEGEIPMLVVLDFLQAVGSPAGEHRQDIKERIGRAAYAGRAVARDFGAAVLMLSSTAREGYKRSRISSDGGDDGGVVVSGEDATNASELVGLGKESGDIEYAADSVMVLVSGDYDRTTLSTPIHLAVAKVRAGRPGWCPLEFDGATFRPGLTEE